MNQALIYTFKDPVLLEAALTHKSYLRDFSASSDIPKRSSKKDNERFEFLGDSILSFVVSEILCQQYPLKAEGELSRFRASLVNEKNLATHARKLGIPLLVKLGKSEESSGGRSKDRILASCFEALIAAIYTDGGFSAVYDWIKKVFEEDIINVTQTHHQFDFKTTLQELAQAKFKQTPHYYVINTFGPDHEKTFEVEVTLHGRSLARATGKSKKEAEQQAARTILETITF